MTASSAVLDRGKSMAGKGGGLARCDRLYSSADVESSIGGGGFGTCSGASDRLRGVVDRQRTFNTLAVLASVRMRIAARLAMLKQMFSNAGRECCEVRNLSSSKFQAIPSERLR